MKVHIGCGHRDWGREWTHIDGGEFVHVVHHDVTLKNFQPEQADIIYSSHLIEYFTRTEVVELLQHWHRVLKPDGELWVGVPDFDAIVKLYHDKEYELEQFLGLLYGEMELNGEKIYHKTVYNHKSLSRLLASVGFKNIHREKTIAPYGEDDHSCAVLPHMNFDIGTPMSLNIIAEK